MVEISIIIPTQNRCKSLELTLVSLLNQDFNNKKFEILVIDNASTDNTKALVNNFIEQNPLINIKYFYEPVLGLLSGRHRGLIESQGEILVFIDDDIEADKRWLSSIALTFIDKNVKLVGGPSLPKYEILPPKWLSYFWHIDNDEKSCSELSLINLGNNLKEIDPNYIWGLNFSIRKDVLLYLGGFHPDCIPSHLQKFQGDGETGLTLKAKSKGLIAMYNPNVLVYHLISKDRLTFEYFDKRYFYQGVCDSYTDIRLAYKSNLDIAPVILSKKQIKKKSIPFQLVPFLKRMLKYFDKEKKLKNRFKIQYNNGYEFHQNAVKDNPELLKWVTKKDYFDYKLPIL